MNNTNIVSTLYYMHYMIHVHAHVSMHVACKKHTFSNTCEKKMTIYWSKFPEISRECPFTYPLPLPRMCWSLLGIHFALCSAELRHFFAFHQGVHQRICCRLVGQRGLKVRTILSTTYIMDVSRQKKKRQKNTEKMLFTTLRRRRTSTLLEPSFKHLDLLRDASMDRFSSLIFLHADQPDQ